jgi:hypothetical protein
MANVKTMFKGMPIFDAPGATVSKVGEGSQLIWSEVQKNLDRALAVKAEKDEKDRIIQMQDMDYLEQLRRGADEADQMEVDKLTNEAKQFYADNLSMGRKSNDPQFLAEFNAKLSGIELYNKKRAKYAEADALALKAVQESPYYDQLKATQYVTQNAAKSISQRDSDVLGTVTTNPNFMKEGELVRDVAEDLEENYTNVEIDEVDPKTGDVVTREIETGYSVVENEDGELEAILDQPTYDNIIAKYPEFDISMDANARKLEAEILTRPEAEWDDDDKEFMNEGIRGKKRIVARIALGDQVSKRRESFKHGPSGGADKAPTRFEREEQRRIQGNEVKIDAFVAGNYQAALAGSVDKNKNIRDISASSDGETVTVRYKRLVQGVDAIGDPVDKWEETTQTIPNTREGAQAFLSTIDDDFDPISAEIGKPTSIDISDTQ